MLCLMVIIQADIMDTTVWKTTRLNMILVLVRFGICFRIPSNLTLLFLILLFTIVVILVGR